MYVKFLLENLNLGSYPPHLTNIYTCEMTTAPKVRGGLNFKFVECKKQKSFIRELIKPRV